MHDTAAAFGAAFFRCYADALEGARILEVGAGDVNGTLRGCAPHGASYTGIDLEAGPGVDIVLSDPYSYPVEPATYDIVVSSSCFEHDQMFWLSFAEMCRVLKAGGFIYLNVPSNGTFHRYPTDNWRFYPDSGLALASWGRRNGHDIRLVESFIGRRRRDFWNDCVMVFGKGDTPRQLSLLAEIFPRSLNIRVGEQEAFSNYCEQTEDMTLQAWMTEKLRSSPAPNGNDDRPTLETLLASLAEREVALGAAERAAAERNAAEIAALQGVLAERESALEDLRTALDAREAALQRAEADAADLRSALGERDAALQQFEATASDLRTIIGEREAALQRAKADAADRDAALRRAEAETADRRALLSEQDAAIAMLKNELVAVRTALAEAENQVDHRARLSARLETEINGLRQTVASLKHEAATVTQRELAAMRYELAASRQVNRSLLAALRTDPVLGPPTERPVGRRRGFFRHLTNRAGGARH